MTHETEQTYGGHVQFRDRVNQALNRTKDYFFENQSNEGYWWGELESNATMEAEYVLLTRFLESDEGDRIPRVAEGIRRRQQTDGSWPMYYGAPGDLSTSVECYFALKLAGDTKDAAHMVRARQFILSKGGVPGTRVFTKIWLALFGQSEWKSTPSMPPELLLLPKWAPFNIYKFASWARATIVPMTIILTTKPVRPVKQNEGIGELFPDGEDAPPLPPRGDRRFSMQNAFIWADRALRLLEQVPLKPVRRRALIAAEQWILAHQEADGSWAGIQPPWVYSLIALNLLGYSVDHPAMQHGLQGFRGKWSHETADGQVIRIQACLSPVWDTSLALLGLLDSGVNPEDPLIQRSAQWLLDEEIRTRGDWAVNVPNLEPSGWAFEFENDSYPDIDDTSIVVMSLALTRLVSQEGEYDRRQAIDRAVRWLTGMQSTNGGWAAFDRNNTSNYLAKIPFADFGELIDPPSVDVTAHVLEMFGRLGYTRQNAAVRKGLAYVRNRQEDDGSWFGRWGVNHVYGTGTVLPALHALGENMDQPWIKCAIRWLLAHQNSDGGWGESCASYVDETQRGKGDSTPSQTAWALISLIAAGESTHTATRHGLEFLIANQQPDGTWEESQFTGCGFPGYGTGDQPATPHSGRQGHELGAAFMINYHLYRNIFPMWALGRFVQCTATTE